MLVFARQQASRLGSVAIETEHLLLGLLREGRSLTRRLFARAQVSRADLRKDVAERTPFREHRTTSVDVPFSAETRRALQAAAEEADRLAQHGIEPEHLLLGLLREERCVAAAILNGRGLRLESVREDIVVLLDDPPVEDDELSFEEGLEPGARRGGPSARLLLASPTSSRRPKLHVSRLGSDPSRGLVVGSGPDYFLARGFTLREVLARLLKVDDRYLEVPPDLDATERYEFAMRLPAAEPSPAIERRVIEGITRYLDISITRERRLLDAYVLTAPRGLTPQITEADVGGSGSVSVLSAVGVVHAIGPLTMTGLTMADLTRSLEGLLGQPVVDATGLEGRYDLEVHGAHEDLERFLTAFQDQLGLAITRAHHRGRDRGGPARDGPDIELMWQSGVRSDVVQILPEGV